MFCTNCGANVDDSAHTCPACGVRAGARVMLQNERPAQRESTPFKGDFWINNMKSIAQLAFLAFIIAGAVSGYAACVFVSDFGKKIVTFLIPFAGFSIAGFLAVAVLMIFLNMASDLREIKNELTRR
jgi:hypothetical protein